MNCRLIIEEDIGRIVTLTMFLFVDTIFLSLQIQNAFIIIDTFNCVLHKGIVGLFVWPIFEIEIVKSLLVIFVIINSFGICYMDLLGKGFVAKCTYLFLGITRTTILFGGLSTMRTDMF